MIAWAMLLSRDTIDKAIYACMASSRFPRVSRRARPLVLEEAFDIHLAFLRFISLDKVELFFFQGHLDQVTS